MLVRDKGWLAALLVLLVLVGGTIKGWQKWQRSHFDCSGEVRVFYPEINADALLQYVFDGNKGVVVLRGAINPQKGKPVPINHNVWFSFSRKGDDFFLRSESVSSSVSGEDISPLLRQVMPTFYLQSGVSFYLNIARIDGSNRLLFTSRSPSILCKS